MFCTSATAMEEATIGPISVAPPPAPMKKAVLPPMNRAAPPPPMARVAPPPPMERVKPQGIAKHQPQARNSNTDAHSQRRSKVIDPNGQGLNQAQIDAMERQRQLMWNATGGGMVYR